MKQLVKPVFVGSAPTRALRREARSRRYGASQGWLANVNDGDVDPWGEDVDPVDAEADAAEAGAHGETDAGRATPTATSDTQEDAAG